MKFQEFINLYAEDGILHLASQDRKEKLAKVLSVPFDPEIHYPLAYIHLHYAMLDEAKAILDHTANKDNETYKQLEDYLNALEECNRSNVGIFPLTVSYRKWWDGPHLQFPDILNGKKFDAWYPLRLEYIEKEIAHVTVAECEHGEITYGSFEFPVAKVRETKANTIGEIAFYGEEYLIKFHEDGKWEQSSELKSVYDKVEPIVKKSRNLLNEAIKREFYDSFVL